MVVVPVSAQDEQRHKEIFTSTVRPLAPASVAQGAPRWNSTIGWRRASPHPSHHERGAVPRRIKFFVGGGVAAFVLAVVTVAAVLIFNVDSSPWLMAPAVRCALSPVPKLRSTVPCWALTSCWPAWTRYWICRRCGRNG